MNPFTLSAFADEIDERLSVQMEELSRHGITHIEMRGVNGKNVTECTLEEAKEIKRQMDDRGFALSAIGSPIGKIGILDPFEPHLDLFRHTLELAGVLGADAMRIFSFYIPEGDDPAQYRDAVLERMEQLISLASAYGVTLLHENEKGIYGDTAQRCYDLLSTLNAPNLRATFDPANFVQCGEDTLAAFDLLAPYVTYVHIKDAVAKDGSVVPAGGGDGNVREILTRLKVGGYRGFLSLEPHLGSFRGAAALEQDDFFKDMPEGGPKLFSIAKKALTDILTEIGAN